MNTVLRAILDWRTVSPEELSLWHAQLDPEKRMRIDTFRLPDDRTRSICADHLARQLLTQTGADGAAIRFSYTDRGKPLCPETGLHFSISHSGFFVACAVATCEIGADIEALRAIRPTLAKRVCTPDELDFIFSEGEFDSTRFLSVWTAKEAYCKYTGEGLAADLRAIPVADGTGLLPEVCGHPLFHEWSGDYAFSIVGEQAFRFEPLV